MINQSEIIIFVGPSITVKDAKKILPHAIYLPPVRCGDVLRALRLQPKIMVIIDGFFQNTAAVWHKELLYAIEKGVTVYGCSSMGALRAAELAEFGMIGVGEIFSTFHAQEINDDDEVAVFHRPAESDYLPTSDAMVNIRATLTSAMDQEVISVATAQQLMIVAKQLFYPERTLQRAMQLVHENGQCSADLIHLEEWLAAGNDVNLKRLDAIELLAGLAHGRFNPVNSKKEFTVNRSLYLRRLYSQIMCRPFTVNCSGLPQTEKVLMKGRLLGSDYLIARHIAQLLEVVDAIAAKEGYVLKVKNFTEFNYPELALKINPRWLQENDTNEYAAQQLLSRLARIDTLLRHYQHSMPDQAETIRDAMMMDLRFNNEYAEYKQNANDQTILEVYQRQNPDNFNLRFIKALLWHFIYYYSQQKGLKPNLEKIQKFSNEFREKNNLLTQTATEEWLAKNDLDLPTYHRLMQMESCYQYFINGHNLDPLGIHCREDIFWLLDAFYLTGLYTRAKQILLDPITEQLLINKLRSITVKDKEEYALNYDFIDGSRELWH